MLSAHCLHLASEAGDAAAVRELLVDGADVNGLACWGAQPPGWEMVFGWVPALHFAAFGGHAEVVALLLDGGADVNAGDAEEVPRGRQRSTALHVAAGAGHAEVVALLLAGGADVNALADWEGDAVPKRMSALLFAAFEGHAEVAALLLNNGADTTLANLCGWPPAYAAARAGHADVVELLLREEGADVNLVCAGGRTLLHTACGSGHAEVAKLLLARGADVHHVTPKGQTPLAVVVDTVHLVHRTPGCNQTPLAIVLDSDHMRVASLLRTAGADPDKARNFTRPGAWELYEAYRAHVLQQRYGFLAAMERRRQQAQASYDGSGKRQRGAGSRGLLTAHLSREVARFL